MGEEVHRVPVEGQKVALVLHLPEHTPAPCVVACHGLGASKDSEKYLLLGREFPLAGIALARLDFRGSGESDGAPQDATIASRLGDVRGVLEFLGRHPDLDGRFGLLGSSMGGYVALFAAAGHPKTLPLVTWNAPATLRDLEGRAGGDSPAVGRALVEELAGGAYRDAPAGVRFCLIIQADRDEVVPPEHGRRLFERAGEPRELAVLRDADHRLSETTHRMEAVERSLGWFGRFFGGSR